MEHKNVFLMMCTLGPATLPFASLKGHQLTIGRELAVTISIGTRSLSWSTRVTRINGPGWEGRLLGAYRMRTMAKGALPLRACMAAVRAPASTVRCLQ